MISLHKKPNNDSDSGFFQNKMTVCLKLRKNPRRMGKKLKTQSKLTLKSLKSLANYTKMSKKARLGQDIIDILAQNTIPIVDLENDESVTVWPEPDPNDVIVIESSENEEDDKETEAKALEESRPKFVIRHYELRTEEQARRAKQAEEYESQKKLVEELNAMLDKQEQELDRNNNTTDGADTESGKSSNESTESNESNPVPKKYGKIKSTIFDKQLFKQKTKVYIRKLYFTSNEYNDILTNGLNVKKWQPIYSKFSFSQINGLSSGGHRHLMMSTDSEPDTESENSKNHSLGKQSDSNDCQNPACTEHGKGDDESESSESDLDLEDNIVQDASGNWCIAVTETHEEETINKLERLYHMKLKLFQSSVYAALTEMADEGANEGANEGTNEAADGTEAEANEPDGATASTSQVNTDSKYPIIIRWHHGGFLDQNAPEDLPHLDDRSLDKNDTVEMTKKQIKNWLAYRQGVENEISRTNRVELIQVATDLRNKLFEIIRYILPDQAKEIKLRLKLRKALRDTLEHIARLPGMSEEVDEILRVHPWPEALTNDAMRRVYVIIAGYVQDVPEKWVYIRRDYRLEDEPATDPRAGERVIKNSDVKVVSRSCVHTLNKLYATGVKDAKCPHGHSKDCEVVDPFSTDESDGEGRPAHTSTPKERVNEQAGVEYIKKSDGSIVSQDANRVAVCKEKSGRIEAELKSRSESIAASRKNDLIRKILIAQAAKIKRRTRRSIKAWAVDHVAKQREESRKATRANDKLENRADPRGKRYMPILEGQPGSSATYSDTESDDSIPEVNWVQYPRMPQRQTDQEQTSQEKTLSEQIAQKQRADEAIVLRRSIRNRVKSANPKNLGKNRKEGCTCPGDECKWDGDCFSPKE